MPFNKRNLTTPDVQRCNSSKRSVRNRLNDKKELHFSNGRKLVILINGGIKEQVFSVPSPTYRSPKQIVPALRKECLELPGGLYTSQSSIKGEFVSLLEHSCWPFDCLARHVKQQNWARSNEAPAWRYFSFQRPNRKQVSLQHTVRHVDGGDFSV